MSFVLPDPFPPPWASEWEEDAEWGLAATLNLNGVKQTFRWIQLGTFLMGSPEGEVGRFDSETQHEVTLNGWRIKNPSTKAPSQPSTKSPSPAATGWRIPRAPRPCGRR